MMMGGNQRMRRKRHPKEAKKSVSALIAFTCLMEEVGGGDTSDSLESQGKVGPRTKAHICCYGRNGKVAITVLVFEPSASLSHTDIVEQLLEILIIALVDNLRHILVIRLYKYSQLVEGEVLRAEHPGVVDGLVDAFR